MMDSAKFERMIPDPGMRDYILNNDLDPFNRNRDFGKVFRNVIHLAFMYALSCYYDLENRNYADDGSLGVLDRCKKEGNANSIRVIQTLEKVYKEYPITDELIQFVLLDIYFDFDSGSKSVLQEYIPECIRPSRNHPLNDYFTIINQTRGRSRTNILRELGEEKLHRMFEKLLQMFPFMCETELAFDKDRQWYAFRIQQCDNFPDGTVNTFGAITRICVQEPLFYNLTDIQNDTLKYELVGSKDYILCPLGDAQDNGYSEGVLQHPFGLPMDEEYVCSYLYPTKLEKKIQYTAACTIEQLFNINYKYIKNLSLSIADALGQVGLEDYIKALERAFFKVYPDAFEKFDPNLKNWDTVVLMLLIEAGPSEVLQKLFYSGQDINEGIATKIIENLVRRSGTRATAELADLKNGKTLRCRAEESVKAQPLFLNKNPIKTKTYDRIYKSLVAEAMANLLLATLKDPEAEKNGKPLDSDLFCIGNTQQNIEALEGLKKCSDPQQKCEGVRIAFGDLIKRIICFYEGIFSYGMKLSTETKKVQEKAETAFVKAADRAYKALSGDEGNSVLYILQKFVGLAEKCFKTEGNTYTSKIDNGDLYTVLGKDSLFDPREFRKHVDIDRLEDLNESNVDWWIDKAIQVIRFLQTGSFDGNTGEHRPYTSIAPFVAGYNKKNDTRDGYHTAMFTLIIDNDNVEDQKRLCEVNVLSEFSYNMSSKYYCLPNIGRSTKKWWIDPLIIKCQLFDDIFEAR